MLFAITLFLLNANRERDAGNGWIGPESMCFLKLILALRFQSHQYLVPTCVRVRNRALPPQALVISSRR